MLAALAAAFLTPHVNATPLAGAVRRVLVFNVFGGLTSPQTALLDQAIFAGLAESLYQVESYRENLEKILFPDEAIPCILRESYICKYQDRKAARVLKGEKTQDVACVKNADIYMFDWRALRRWGYKKSDLLSGSLVLNRWPSVWESHKGYIIGSISLMLAEALLIFGLVWQRTRRRKAETELAIAHDRLRLSVEAGSSVGWDWDIKSGQERRFGDLKTIFGIPRDTYSGKVEDFRRSIHPEDRKLVWRTLIAARKERKPFAAEFRVVRTDGTVLWITARGKFYYAQNGDSERMLGIAADITDRKLAEQKLHESQNQLAGIVGLAMDGIIAIDEEQHIVLFNAAAEKMFGCTANEAIGGPVDRFIPQGFLADDREHIGRLNESGLTSQAIGLRANGQEFPIEASISQIESGGTRLFTVIIRDITERRRAEQAIRESEERFRLVANKAPVMIWMSGPDKLCTYVNDPWLEFTGRPLEAELGNGWTDGVHPEDLSCLNTYTQAFDRREAFKMQYRLRRHDGQYRWVFDIGVPRLGADGSFAGYIGSSIDVTDRKLAEEALASVGRRLMEAHEEERTWIARELHDDINQRIALLALEIEQAKQNIPESAVEAQLHMRRLRGRLSEIGKEVQALSHRLHSSKLDYLGIVAAARSFCKEVSEQQKVEVDFSHQGIPQDVPKEVSVCLFRVLQEALQNAVKHSGARHFRIELHGTSREIRLTVNDVGVGFNQLEAINRRGLGLISMRERLQLVGGQFLIKSEPGRGTTICARVPLETEPHGASVAAIG